ncbi:MAG: AtpZ/AtpI family protein [Deltaproteobacteria bacterium]|nr:AtpZ/AtpI family protein [Deltaproteobacteria bacterium]
MEQETKQMFKDLAYYSSLGFSIALSIFIGLFIGLALDRTLDTAPWLMFVFLGLGIAAGFRNILRAMAKSQGYVNKR